MTDEFIRHGLTTSVAQICSNIGWHSMSNSTLQMMTDILYEYFKDLAQSVKKFSEISDTITPDLDDVKMAFQDKDVSIPDLIKYLKQVGSIEFPHLIPKFPIPTKSNLNIMKPGSREIVTRPIYMHEHLPTMFPEQSDEKTTQNDKIGFNQTLQSSSSLNMFNDTSHFQETQTSKNDKTSKNKMVTHRRLREISSVVMTTSGFLSPSREGKLPESRLMPISNLKASSNPSTVKLSSPKILPDVKTQPQHNKQLSQKPAVVVKEKEKKVPETNIHNVHNIHNIVTNKDSKFKKSSNFKEISKPNKLLKKEIICEPNQDTQLKKPLKLKNKSKLNLLNTIFDKPIQAKHPKYSSNEKLNAEPDKQKLNIFKKISKVKDDKNSESVGHSNSKTNVSIVSKPNSTIVSTDILVKPKITPEVIEEKPFKPVFFKPHVEEKKQDKKPPTKEITPELNSEIIKKRKKKQKMLTDNLNSPNVNSTSSNNGAKKLKIKHDPDVYSKFSFFGLTSPSGLLQPGTSLLPPSLASNPLVPKYTTPRVLPNLEKESSITSMMYLPLPGEEDYDKSKLSQLSLPFNSEKEKVPTEKIKSKKGHKKIKKEKIKSKKKKEKKDKSKEKTKSERKKEKLLKKMKKDLEEPKEETVILEKKEELINSILNEDDPLVPKIKLKFSGSNSPSSSSSSQRKIVIKPVVKNKSLDCDDTTVHNVSKEMPVENIKSAITKSKVHSKDKNPTVPVSTLLTSNKEDSTVKTIDPKPSKSKKSTVILPSTVENISTSHEISSDPSPLPISSDNAVASGNKHKIKTSKKPKKLSTQSPPAFYFDESGNQVWICPTCGKKDDGSPMIGCDGCDAWYHWVCVGIQCPPDCAVWYCPKCLLKRAQRSVTGLPVEKAKRGRPLKKKSIL